jgi:hypothetical protein
MCWKKKAKLKCGCTLNRRKIAGLPSDQDHDAALNVLIDECKKKLMSENLLLSVLKKITIEWWDNTAHSPSTGELKTVVAYNGQVYSGLTVGYLCMVAWRGKLYRSAFIHEILHVIGGDILNDPDPNHQNQTLKELECTTNGILAQMNL